MGLFDFMLSPEKKIAKNVRRLTNRDSQPEDREASANWLADEGSPQAIMGLLSRFDMKLDHQLKDQGEKEHVFDLLHGLGEKSVEPARAWLRQCRAVARPLALLGHIRGEEAAIEAAFEILAIEAEHGNDFKPQKKKAVLIWLAERRHDGAVEAARPFLDDFDEGVRYAAAEVLIGQNDPETAADLVGMLTNPEEDSNRLKVRVCEVLMQRRWPVGDAAEELVQALPDGFTVRDGRIVR